MHHPLLAHQQLPGRTPRRSRLIAALAAAVAVLCAGLGVLLPATASAALPLTKVSLTFDDANADQIAAAATLTANGMRGTFYIPSGFVDSPGYMTRANLTSLAADGHEIGGHSVTHPDLTTLPTAEAQRQICNDRVNLKNWGFQVSSFAYPFAAATSATETIAKNCGYNSARGLGDIQSRFGCSGCPTSEATPPADLFYTKALDQVDNTWTLADLQAAVTNAETHNGGWVQLTFHHVCVGCDSLAVTPTVLNQFVAWLKPRAASNNTVVQTVNQVIGGAVKPTVNGPVVAPPAAGANGVKNPSLETAGTAGLPQCWMAGGYGTNTPTFATTTTTANAHAGSRAENLTVTGYSSGDAKLLPTFDLGGCSPSVTPGRTYSLRGWYKSSTVTQFALYYRTGVGTWTYWTSSPWFAASTTYTQAVWTTPAVPAGVTGISFGLSKFNNGTMTTDDYAAYDTVGAPAAAAAPAPASAAAPTPASTAPASKAPATTPPAAAAKAGVSADAAPAPDTERKSGSLAAIVPAPPGASKKVAEHSPVYAPKAGKSPTGPSAHRARANRHGPAAERKVNLIPGPNAAEPGTPIVLGHDGAVSG